MSASPPTALPRLQRQPSLMSDFSPMPGFDSPRPSPQSTQAQLDEIRMELAEHRGRIQQIEEAQREIMRRLNRDALQPPSPCQKRN